MKKLNIKSLLAVLMLLGMLIVGWQQKSQTKTSRVDHLPFYNEATFTPIWLEPNAKELDDFHKIPDFKLINQDSAVITQETFEDKIYVADFFFTACPGICKKMTKYMGQVQAEFIDDEEILLLSHSVTPESDSVSRLINYADRNAVITSKWHLTTGDREEIYALGRRSYFVEQTYGISKEEDDFLHTENFVLIDKNKHIRGIYNGINQASVNQLIADIKTLKKEFKDDRS